MTSKAALCLALLEGKVVNIKNCFENFGISNAPREIGRSVERAFGVSVTKMPCAGTSRYGQPIRWYNYMLNPLREGNKEGIEKMRDYVLKQMGTPKTDKQQKQFKKLEQLRLL
jgi:hypothetical protein